MNGFIKTTAAGLLGAAGLVSVSGCYSYREVVDPCWPERYNAVARHTIRDTMNAQAGNGHLLDQAVWNWQFDMDPVTKAPTDRLNPAGIKRLEYLARRRPSPDCTIILETAHDIPVDAKNPVDAQAPARNDLDARRSAAIQRFMNDYNTGRVPAVAFHVEVMDVADPSVHSLPLAGSLRLNNVTGAYPRLVNSYTGVLPDTSAFGISSTSSGGGGGGGGSK